MWRGPWCYWKGPLSYWWGSLSYWRGPWGCQGPLSRWKGPQNDQRGVMLFLAFLQFFLEALSRFQGGAKWYVCPPMPPELCGWGDSCPSCTPLPQPLGWPLQILGWGLMKHWRWNKLADSLPGFRDAILIIGTRFVPKYIARIRVRFHWSQVREYDTKSWKIWPMGCQIAVMSHLIWYPVCGIFSGFCVISWNLNLVKPDSDLDNAWTFQ